jgi:hypothetical protein
LRSIVFVSIALLAFQLVGCGSKAGVPLDATVPVQGKVLLDRKPLAEGEIKFAVDGKPPQILRITEGVYSGQAVAGENRIEIAVYKTETDSMTNTPVKVNTLPARFNFQSTLKASVASGSPNDFDFEVQSN